MSLVKEIESLHSINTQLLRERIEKLERKLHKKLSLKERVKVMIRGKLE
jgi:hypothetical protein